MVVAQVAVNVLLFADVWVTVRLQLVQRLLVTPALELHAIDGTVSAGAMRAGETVDENRKVRRVAHHFEELIDPLLHRRRLPLLSFPGQRADADELHAQVGT